MTDSIYFSRDYYHPESLQLQDEQFSYLLSILYDLNEVHFDLSSHGHDLDVSWPTFARKVFGSPSRWRAPSRTASLTSLTSIVSQVRCLKMFITGSTICVNFFHLSSKMNWYRALQILLEKVTRYL